jgi:hypothetical protein
MVDDMEETPLPEPEPLTGEAVTVQSVVDDDTDDPEESEDED